MSFWSVIKKLHKEEIAVCGKHARYDSDKYGRGAERGVFLINEYAWECCCGERYDHGNNSEEYEAQEIEEENHKTKCIESHENTSEPAVL